MLPQSRNANPAGTMRLRLLPLLLCLGLAACFKPEIRQGNFLSDDKIALVKPGMTQAQVQFVLGPPMAHDPLVVDRWDYLRYVNPNDGDPEQIWHVIINFKDGKVVRVDQPPVVNKQEQLQLPTVKDATELPPDQNNGPATPSDTGAPPPL
jgi:outer membrane protein assembly factor BamE (lipoprotein component of BamABCDE complex)